MAHKNKTNYSPYKARREKALAKHAGSSSSLRSGTRDVASAASPRLRGDGAVNATENIAGGGGKNVGARGRHRPPEKIFSLEEANDRLYDLFRNHEFSDYSHAKRRQLAHFYTLLMEIQKKENFTRLTELREIGLKHFIDCLMIPRLTELRFPLMDVGTGPGFPGIPLKIEFPEQTIVLAEGVQRRVEFLKEVRDQMALSHLPILGRNINQECFYPVRGVITRAVEDIRNTLGNVLHCLQTGGRVYFMKGPGVDPEIPMALEVWKDYYRLVEDHRYFLPKTEQERRLLVFEKIKTAEVSDEWIESLGLNDESSDHRDFVSNKYPSDNLEE